MSRFLKKRHYKLIIVGVYYYMKAPPKLITSLEQSIMSFLNITGVSYTIEDVAEIQTMFLSKYGQEDGTRSPYSN